MDNAELAEDLAFHWIMSSDQRILKLGHVLLGTDQLIYRGGECFTGQQDYLFVTKQA